MPTLSSAIDAPARRAFDDFAAAHGLLPIKVTAHYRRLVEEEVEALGGPGGPLHRVVYPSPDRLGSRVPDEVRDFVEDRGNMPGGVQDLLIHKYPDRLLCLLTHACAAHCMYCFRQDVLTSMRRDVPMGEKLEELLRYLGEHPEVREVVFSGGDPLSVPPGQLEDLFSRVVAESGVRDLRLHTRNLVFAPRVLSDEVCRVLAANRVRLYVHAVHPYELEGEVAAALHRARRHGIRCYSQFPILRGINDHPEVLVRLLRDLDELEARAVNVYAADPINFSAPFRVSLERLFGLMDAVYWKTPSWLSAPRIVLDTPVGKVRREDIVSWDREEGLVVFERQVQRVSYRDFPRERDEPGELARLLWKG